MSAVRLGPVTITNSPRTAGSAARATTDGPDGRQVLGQLFEPGNHHARRRQVTEQPVLGRRAGHQARARIGQQGLRLDHARRKLGHLPRLPVGGGPAHHARRQLGGRVADHAAGPSRRARSSRPCGPVRPVAAGRLASWPPDHFALDDRQFLRKLFGHRLGRRARRRPNLGHRRQPTAGPFASSPAPAAKSRPGHIAHGHVTFLRSAV